MQGIKAFLARNIVGRQKRFWHCLWHLMPWKLFVAKKIHCPTDAWFPVTDGEGRLRVMYMMGCTCEQVFHRELLDVEYEIGVDLAKGKDSQAMTVTMFCCHEGCDQPAKFWLGTDEESAVHSCPDHVDDLRRKEDAVYRLDPETGEAGEQVGDTNFRDFAEED